MKFRDYWNTNSSKFAVLGINDKVLTENGIRYLLFFDVDEKEIDEISVCRTIEFPFRLFKTKNGFHAIGFGLHPGITKKLWFEKWKKIYPNADFLLYNGTLRPTSQDELSFIVEQAFSQNLLIEPTILKYYRDKKVFESFSNE